MCVFEREDWRLESDQRERERGGQREEETKKRAMEGGREEEKVQRKCENGEFMHVCVKHLFG